MSLTRTAALRGARKLSLLGERFLSTRTPTPTPIPIPRSGPATSRVTLRRLLTWAIGSSVGAVALAGAGVAYLYNTDEGMRRTIYFWANAFPMYLHYRFVEWQVQGLSDSEQDPEYNKLHDTYCYPAFNLILQLRGFYIKIGQIAATRADFLPKQYLDLVTTLQDEVPYRPIHEVKKIVEDALGEPLEKIFTSFDEVPIGSASIGQVHRAVLKDGRQVAVKVMYPNAEEGFRQDIKTIKDFCKLAQPAHLPVLNEIEKQFLTEFDYRREANNLEEVATNLAKAKEPWVKLIVVPQPLKHLCRENVLVMDYIQGIKLVTGIKRQYRLLAQQEGLTLDEFIAKQKAMKKPDERAPTAFQINVYRSFLRSSDYLRNLLVFLYNWTVRPVFRLPQKHYRWTVLPINIPEVIDILLKVHAHEIFMDGCFNGDPHPGNILLMDDGRLGLIDYGQVKHLTEAARIKLAKIIIALAKDDRETVVKSYDEMGVRTKYMNPEALFAYAQVFYDRDDFEVTKGMNIQLYIEHLDKIDPIVKLADDYVMAGRVSTLLRGLGYAFGYNLRVSQAWEPVARKFLASKGVKI